MSSYIDADKAKEKKVYSKDRHEYVVPVAELDWLPTADVQEVRHGRWSHFLCYNTCSLCGGVYVHEYDDGAKIQDFAFCQFCGAKMDEEEQQ